MQRLWWALSALALFSLHPFAASAHRLPKMRAVSASAGVSSALDHVPVAAERIAAAYGVVTSTFRTVAHNREVGGVPDSYHLLGRAMDVARKPGISHAQIAAALRAAGFFLIESLDEGNHSHFAFGPRANHVPPPPPPPSASPAEPQLAADKHGSLLSDLNAPSKRQTTSGPVLRAHIRGKPLALNAR